MLRAVPDIKQSDETAKSPRTASGRYSMPSAKSRRGQQFPAESFLQKGDGTEIRDGATFDDAQDSRVRDTGKTPNLTDAQSLLVNGSDESAGEQAGVLGGDVGGQVGSEPFDAFSGDFRWTDSFSLHGATVDQRRMRATVPHDLVGAPADFLLANSQGSCQTPRFRSSIGLYIDHQDSSMEAEAMAKTKPERGILLIDAVDQVLKHWQDTGALTELSLDKFDDLLHRYTSFASKLGASSLSDQSEEIAAQWIAAKGRVHGVPKEPSLATQNTRRSALRKFYRDAEELKLTDSGLIVRTHVPPRPTGLARPLSDDEARTVWMYANDAGPQTRRPVMFALLLSGIHSSEAGLITVSDVDLDNHRVWAHGDTKRIKPRWVQIPEPFFTAVVERIDFIRVWLPPHYDAERFQLTQGQYAASRGAHQNRAASACKEVFKMVGLHKLAEVTPSSVSLYAGSRMLREGERIETITQILGYASLDSCAGALGYNWETGEIA
jgi:site-specific recombinase XerD